MNTQPRTDRKGRTDAEGNLGTDEVEQHVRSAIANLKGGTWADHVVGDVLHDVANLPDRTSPDDWPDAMLVTAAELRQIVLDAIRAERT